MDAVLPAPALTVPPREIALTASAELSVRLVAAVTVPLVVMVFPAVIESAPTVLLRLLAVAPLS